MKPYAERGTTQRAAEAEAILASLVKLGDLGAPANAAALRALQPRIAALHAAIVAGKGRGGSKASANAINASNAKALADYYERMRPVVERLRCEGIVTYGRIAETLNARGVPSFSGKPWKLGMAFTLIKNLQNAQETEAA